MDESAIPNRKNGKIWPFVVVIILILGFCTAYAYTKGYFGSPQTPTPLSTSIQKNNNQQSSVSDTTTKGVSVVRESPALLTYSIPKFKLQFSYPSNLSIEQKEKFLFFFDYGASADSLNKLKSYLENSPQIKPGSVKVISADERMKKYMLTNKISDTDFPIVQKEFGSVIEADFADSQVWDTLDPNDFFGKDFISSVPKGFQMMQYHPLILDIFDGNKDILQLSLEFPNYPREQFTNNYKGQLQDLNNISWYVKSSENPNENPMNEIYDEGWGQPLSSGQTHLAPLIKIQNEAYIDLLPEDRNPNTFSHDEKDIISIASTIRKTLIIGVQK